ncbi:MAG TPA: hypothetical protein VGC19_06010 [Rhodanobacter sp.]
MSIEVAMGDCLILAMEKTSERYVWTAGIGDCLAIAAKNDKKFLFAHLTGKQYYPESMGGGENESLVRDIKKFLDGCRKDNVLVATNFRHSGKGMEAMRLYTSPAIRLGYDHFEQLRYGGTDTPGAVTLDIIDFQMYFSTPDSVSDPRNVRNDMFGWTNKKAKKGLKARSGCAIM